MTEEAKPRTIQIAPDAPAHVKIYTVSKASDAMDRILHEFDVSRNIAVGLLPKLEEVLEPYTAEELHEIRVRVSINGKNPENGADLEMVRYEDQADIIMPALRGMLLENEHAVMAARSFFQDMFDMVDMKALLFVGVFDKGQTSFVMTNRTVEVESKHMLRLVMTTLAQLDKLRAHMEANGITVPGQGPAIVTPDSADFRDTLRAAKDRKL